MSRRNEQRADGSASQWEELRSLPSDSPTLRPSDSQRRPFRAADVLTGSIDRLRQPAARPNGRNRKQISAQLEPAQVRLLGELQARLNETSLRRIEKSDLVGLGIELLAAVLDGIEDEFGEFAPAPDAGVGSRQSAVGREAATGPRDVEELRTYLRTHVRGYVNRSSNGRR